MIKTMINKNLWKESDAVTDALSFTVTLQCAWNIHKQPKRGQSFPHLKRIQKDKKNIQSAEIQNFHAPCLQKYSLTHPLALSFPKTIVLLKNC